MKLLLTSGGLSTPSIEQAFLGLLSKPPEENKALIMGVHPGIQDFDFNAYIDRNVQMLANHGFALENIGSYKIDSDSPPTLEDIDVLLMLGGNEYRHMKWIREKGLMPSIRKFVENNGVYLGRSAGAIIMGPDVDVEHWSITPNDVGLEDTAGFGFVDFITVPHMDWRENFEKVVDFHKKSGHKMIYLTDQQAVLVKDDTYKII
jgi:dipeptidase E